ncbi:hypothetical protein Lmor_2847 [Legionella moravica]|uniref:Uncharacterized protein n=1 Tax=Legionella moravica TaxID=39962 RepID=A0A378JYE0_9GAMM|nr:hypothetical protein [Legionella moravica]KTD30740.1 hypothetical protein Lmor_2847 [Legionella moravica]STX63436.1 Uncharacterised protein [Legionella moravica]
MKAHNLNMIYMLIMGLFISMFLNQDRIIRVFYNDEIKHAVPIASSRSYLGDEYHYYAEASESLKIGLISKDKVYSTNNVLFGSLFVSGIVNYVCHTLIPSSDISVLLSLIIQAMFLVVSTMVVIKVIGNFNQKNSVWWVGFWAAIALILYEYFMLNSYYGAIHLRPLLSFYPNVLRIVNPQMGWAYGLFYISLLFIYLNKITPVRFVILCLMSLVFCFFSPSLCLMMLLAMAFIFLINLCFLRSIDYSFLTFSAFLLISFLFNYYQLYNFQHSPKGMEIATGVVKNLVFKPHYFIFMLLLIPLRLFYKGKEFIFLASLLISSVVIGSLCESIHLGERLWVRGGGYWVWILIIILLGPTFKKRINNVAVPVVGLLLISIWSFFLLPHHFDKQYGYISQDKWVVLDWINRHAPKNSIIASDDLEFSFLLPIYTRAQPFVPLFSYSKYSAEETVKRFYYILGLYGSKNKVQKHLNEFTLENNIKNIQAVTDGHEMDDTSFLQNAFFNHLIYYPFTTFSKNAFSSVENMKSFYSILNNWQSDDYSGDKHYDFLIRKIDSSSISESHKVVFKSNAYFIEKI